MQEISDQGLPRSEYSMRRLGFPMCPWVPMLLKLNSGNRFMVGTTCSSHFVVVPTTHCQNSKNAHRLKKVGKTPGEHGSPHVLFILTATPKDSSNQEQSPSKYHGQTCIGTWIADPFTDTPHWLSVQCPAQAEEAGARNNTDEVGGGHLSLLSLQQNSGFQPS